MRLRISLRVCVGPSARFIWPCFFSVGEFLDETLHLHLRGCVCRSVYHTTFSKQPPGGCVNFRVSWRVVFKCVSSISLSVCWSVCKKNLGNRNNRGFMMRLGVSIKECPSVAPSNFMMYKMMLCPSIRFLSESKNKVGLNMQLNTNLLLIIFTICEAENIFIYNTFILN